MAATSTSTQSTQHRVYGSSSISKRLTIPARVGYIAKGIVYVVLGGMAARAAFGAGGQTTGPHGAIRTLLSEPYGQVIVGALAIGLACYAVWRWVQLILDPEGNTYDQSKAAAWGRRGVYLVSAVIHTALAVSAFSLVVGFGGASSGGGGKTYVALVMQWPGGQWLVVAAGLLILLGGIMEFAKVYKRTYRQKLDLRRFKSGLRKAVGFVASVGLVARSIIFAIIGVLFVVAGVQYDAASAGGTSEALKILRDQPWLLGAIGLGLVAYGVFQFIKGGFRRINVTNGAA